MALVPSYSPPAGDPIGDTVRGRAWTYDSAVTAAALAVSGDIDGATAILDRLQELQRPDGALDASYDLAGGDPAGPLRSGNQAWVGLAALATGAARHALGDGIEIADVARDVGAHHRIADAVEDGVRSLHFHH